ncbi:MAG TPA: hypothetical protein VIW46_07015, partial [Acidimicrobiia bacterium]
WQLRGGRSVTSPSVASDASPRERNVGNSHECRRDGLDPAPSDDGPLQLSMLTVSPSNLSLLLCALP